MNTRVIVWLLAVVPMFALAQVSAPEARSVTPPAASIGAPLAPFERADQLALNTTAADEASIDALAKHFAGLTRPEQVRAITRWVAEHIAYDVAALGSPLTRVPTEQILARHLAVCDGYVGITAALFDRFGIPYQRYEGVAKVADGEVKEHAWLGIEVDKKLRLIDPAWMAGYVGNNGFHREFREYYFLAEPNDFALSHWSEKPYPGMKKLPLSEFEHKPYFDYVLLTRLNAPLRARLAGVDHPVTVRTPVHHPEVKVNDAPLVQTLPLAAHHFDVEGNFGEVALVEDGEWKTRVPTTASRSEFVYVPSPGARHVAVVVGTPGDSNYDVFLEYDVQAPALQAAQAAQADVIVK